MFERPSLDMMDEYVVAYVQRLRAKLGDNVPPEHIHAAVAACHTYGKLPISEDLNDVHFEIPKRESFSEFMRQKGESVEI
jgi:hypothetical protein